MKTSTIRPVSTLGQAARSGGRLVRLSTLRIRDRPKHWPDLTPIWHGGLVRMYCPKCATWDCAPHPSTLSTHLGKWRRARARQLSAGVQGDYGIQMKDGAFVARRGRKFFDRRLIRRPAQPCPWPTPPRQLCGSTVQPQYLRERRMYSVNAETTLAIDEAKRWRTRQAAHKANKPLGGRVVRFSRLSTLDPQLF